MVSTILIMLLSVVMYGDKWDDAISNKNYWSPVVTQDHSRRKGAFLQLFFLPDPGGAEAHVSPRRAKLGKEKRPASLQFSIPLVRTVACYEPTLPRSGNYANEMLVGTTSFLQLRVRFGVYDHQEQLTTTSAFSPVHFYRSTVFE